MKIGSVFGTGANRGIGFEFVKQFAQFKNPPSFIFATYRNKKTLGELEKLRDDSTNSRIIPIKMDVTVPEEIAEAKKVVDSAVGDRGLNLLVNSAGIRENEAFPNITGDNLVKHFQANSVGQVLTFQALYPLLVKAAKVSEIKGMSASRAAVLNISSFVASIQKTGVEFTNDLVIPGYKISKAALNMAVRVLAANVKDEGILVVNMCPGWVQTDMGGKETGQISPEESIGDMLATLGTLDESHTGSYMDRLGDRYPF